MDTCKYWIALIRYSWPNAHGEGGIAQTIKDIPICSTFDECHRFVEDLSAKALFNFANEVDFLTRLDHFSGTGQKIYGPEIHRWLSEEAPWRAEQWWLQLGADISPLQTITRNFDRSQSRPLLLNITPESSSKDLEAVTELLNCNLAGELMSKGLLRMVIDKMEAQGTDMIEKRGWCYYGNSGDNLYDFGGSKVWPGLETDLTAWNEQHEEIVHVFS